MATTANISYNGFEQEIYSDGYPSQIIPNILKIYENINNNKKFNSGVDYSFKSEGDYTLNYTYKILDDNKTLKFEGYKKDESIYYDLETLSKFYNNEIDGFTSDDLMEIFEEIDIFQDYLNPLFEESLNLTNYTEEEKNFMKVEQKIVEKLIVGLNISEKEFKEKQLEKNNENTLDM